MRALLNWFDDRTGHRLALDWLAKEKFVGGSRWRLAWGSTIVFTFVLEAITGLFLWMSYNPSAQTAWESVYYIQYQMQGGWFLRGLHHFAGQAMVILLCLYVLQLVVRGAYRAPRELHFWVVLVMLLVGLAFLLTGDLLPWDQKGYWSTTVRTGFLSLIPWIGGDLQKLAIAGPAFGHHTLSQFFALHAGLLPAAFAGLLILSGYLLRRHGREAIAWSRKRDTTFWPSQTSKNAIACLVVLVAVLCFVLARGEGASDAGAIVGSDRGAPLGAPADPADAFAAARPEWAFLWLYEFTSWFSGGAKVFGVFLFPSLMIGVVFLLPFLARKRWGHPLGVMYFLGFAGAIVWMSWLSLEKDAQNQEHLDAVVTGWEEADRAKVLAGEQGIPIGGALALVHNDAKTQGPKLFKRHCACCHDYAGKDGKPFKSEKPTAPNLYEFGSRKWLVGLLDPKQVSGPNYFGNTKFKNAEMAGFVKDSIKSMEAEEKAELVQKLIPAVSSQAGLMSQRESDRKDAKQIAEGIELVKEVIGCVDCHRFQNKPGAGNAPNLTNWGSRQWIIDITANPKLKRFYSGENDRMPAFAEHPTAPEKNVLSQRDIGLIADWLRGEWFEPETVAAE
ncbi:MAG: cytochrome b N-terminal domain-containing protein [Pirellulales bacterium]